MNKNLYYLLLPVLLLAVSCKKDNATIFVLPTGTFTGPYTVIHLNPATGKLDTAKANLILTMATATGFAVTGDTSKVHAGSYGSYAADGTYIEFSDKTLPTTATATTPIPVKKHLNGIYNYTYDGTNLLIYGSNDTLGFTYSLKAN